MSLEDADCKVREAGFEGGYDWVTMDFWPKYCKNAVYTFAVGDTDKYVRVDAVEGSVWQDVEPFGFERDARKFLMQQRPQIKKVAAVS